MKSEDQLTVVGFGDKSIVFNATDAFGGRAYQTTDAAAIFRMFMSSMPASTFNNLAELMATYTSTGMGTDECIRRWGKLGTRFMDVKAGEKFTLVDDSWLTRYRKTTGFAGGFVAIDAQNKVRLMKSDDLCLVVAA